MSANEPIYSASLRCANLARLEEDIQSLETAGCGELHIEVMDGVFVRDFGLGIDTVKAVRGCTDLAICAHLMARQPERFIDRFVEAGCTAVTVHVEASVHAHRTLGQIRDAGAAPGIALNPSTPLTDLDYLFTSADRVLVLCAEPGAPEPKLLQTAFERVRILAENIVHRNLNCAIEVKGGLKSANAAMLTRLGAGIVVCDRSNVFTGNEAPGPALEAFRQAVAAAEVVA